MWRAAPTCGVWKGERLAHHWIKGAEFGIVPQVSEGLGSALITAHSQQLTHNSFCRHRQKLVSGGDFYLHFCWNYKLWSYKLSLSSTYIYWDKENDLNSYQIQELSTEDKRLFFSKSPRAPDNCPTVKTTESWNTQYKWLKGMPSPCQRLGCKWLSRLFPAIFGSSSTPGELLKQSKGHEKEETSFPHLLRRLMKLRHEHIDLLGI